MTASRGKRIATAALVVIAALAVLAWYGDLPSSTPVEFHENGGGEPLLQSPEIAVALVARALLPYGGLPHDAGLTALADERVTEVSSQDRSGRSIVVGFDPTFEPRDALLWNDRIVARVEAVTQQRCADDGTLPARYEPRVGLPPTCRRYMLTFPLHVTSLQRAWRPWIFRRVVRWRANAFAPRVAAPASVTTTCPRLPDVNALRRVVAAVGGPDYAMSLILDRKHTEPLWTMAAAQPNATIARWSPPYPPVHLDRPAGIMGVIVIDAPRRLVTVRFTPPIQRLDRAGASVLTFTTSDDEPVCGPPGAPAEPHLVRSMPAWGSVVAIVRARAETEVRWRTAGHRAPLSSRVVSVDRRPGSLSTIVIETVQPSDGRWQARFIVDERVPEIRDAEFSRTAL